MSESARFTIRGGKPPATQDEVADVVLSSRPSKQDFVHIMNTTFAEHDEMMATLREALRQPSKHVAPEDMFCSDSKCAHQCFCRAGDTMQLWMLENNMRYVLFDMESVYEDMEQKFSFFRRPSDSVADTLDPTNVTYSARRRLLTKLVVDAAAAMRRNPALWTRAGELDMLTRTPTTKRHRHTGRGAAAAAARRKPKAKYQTSTLVVDAEADERESSHYIRLTSLIDKTKDGARETVDGDLNPECISLARLWDKIGETAEDGRWLRFTHDDFPDGLDVDSDVRLWEALSRMKALGEFKLVLVRGVSLEESPRRSPLRKKRRMVPVKEEEEDEEDLRV